MFVLVSSSPQSPAAGAAISGSLGEGREDGGIRAGRMSRGWKRLRLRWHLSFLNRRQVGHQGIDGGGVLGLPGLNLRLIDLCDLNEQVHAPEQDVDMLRLEDQLSLSAPPRSSLPLHGRPAQQHRDRQFARPP